MDAQMQPMDHLIDRYFLLHRPEDRDRIVEAHLHIAGIIARKFSGRGVEYDDLYQVAALALVKALERYDPGQGVKFSSFITPCMVGEVKNYFRDKSRAIRPPRRSFEIGRDVARVRERLEQEFRRSPRVDEIAQALGIGEEQVIEALETASAPVSLDQQLTAADDTHSIEDFLGTEEKAYDAFEIKDMFRRVSLTDEQAEVIRLRFYENKSQREIAQMMGVSQMWVSRTERRAIETMRREIGEDI